MPVINFQYGPATVTLKPAAVMLVAADGSEYAGGHFDVTAAYEANSGAVSVQRWMLAVAPEDTISPPDAAAFHIAAAELTLVHITAKSYSPFGLPVDVPTIRLLPPGVDGRDVSLPACVLGWTVLSVLLHVEVGGTSTATPSTGAQRHPLVRQVAFLEFVSGTPEIRHVAASGSAAFTFLDAMLETLP